MTVEAWGPWSDDWVEPDDADLVLYVDHGLTTSLSRSLLSFCWSTMRCMTAWETPQSFRLTLIVRSWFGTVGPSASADTATKVLSRKPTTRAERIEKYRGTGMFHRLQIRNGRTDGWISLRPPRATLRGM